MHVTVLQFYSFTVCSFVAYNEGISATKKVPIIKAPFERKTRFEPATLSLGS